MLLAQLPFTLLLSLIPLTSALPQPAATSTAVIPTNTPITFYANLYNNSNTCSGSNRAFLKSMTGPCTNYTVPQKGAVILRVGDWLAGWSQPGCAGDILVNITQADVCAVEGESLAGGAVPVSWSGGP
jgi:hypothetical protein